MGLRGARIRRLRVQPESAGSGSGPNSLSGNWLLEAEEIRAPRDAFGYQPDAAAVSKVIELFPAPQGLRIAQTDSTVTLTDLDEQTRRLIVDGRSQRVRVPASGW